MPSSARYLPSRLSPTPAAHAHHRPAGGREERAPHARSATERDTAMPIVPGTNAGRRAGRTLRTGVGRTGAGGFPTRSAPGSPALPGAAARSCRRSRQPATAQHVRRQVSAPARARTRKSVRWTLRTRASLESEHELLWGSGEMGGGYLFERSWARVAREDERSRDVEARSDASQL